MSVTCIDFVLILILIRLLRLTALLLCDWRTCGRETTYLYQAKNVNVGCWRFYGISREVCKTTTRLPGLDSGLSGRLSSSSKTGQITKKERGTIPGALQSSPNQTRFFPPKNCFSCLQRTPGLRGTTGLTSKEWWHWNATKHFIPSQVGEGTRPCYSVRHCFCVFKHRLNTNHTGQAHGQWTKIKWKKHATQWRFCDSSWCTITL